MREPSDDQAGSPSEAGALVNCTILDLSTLITNTSLAAPRMEEKAMRSPSGDQAGPKSISRLSVRRTNPQPSTSIAYISRPPSRPPPPAARRPRRARKRPRPPPARGGGGGGTPRGGVVGQASHAGAVDVH